MYVAEHGKGRLFLYPERLEPKKLAGVINWVITEAIPVPFVSTNMKNIEIVPWEGPDGEMVLFVVNLDPRQDKQGTLAVRGLYSRAQELTCEARPDIPTEKRDGTTRLKLRLHRGGCLILTLK